MAALSPWIALIIRRRREGAGLSQEALAEAAHLHRTYISLIELAKRNPTVDALDRIAIALHISASRIVAEAERARTKVAR